MTIGMSVPFCPNSPWSVGFPICWQQGLNMQGLGPGGWVSIRSEAWVLGRDSGLREKVYPPWALAWAVGYICQTNCAWFFFQWPGCKTSNKTTVKMVRPTIYTTLTRFQLEGDTITSPAEPSHPSHHFSWTTESPLSVSTSPLVTSRSCE